MTPFETWLFWVGSLSPLGLIPMFILMHWSERR